MSLKMFWKISISTIQNALRQSLGGVCGGREAGDGRLRERKSSFLKKGEKLRGWERVGISYDLVCTFREN